MNSKSLMVAMGVSGLLVGANAATTYSEEGSTLVATVSSASETNEFDSTYADALNANTYTAFEKRGDGGLFMPNDISSYMGTVTVRVGSLGYRKSTSLGSLAAGNGAVTVIDGATLFIPNTDNGVTANTVSPLGKAFRLAGMGVNGAGAVDLRSEQQKCPMGTNITLTADTRVRNRTQYYWGFTWGSPQVAHRCRLDMGGHVLRLYSEASTPQFRMVDVVNPGHIEQEHIPSTFTLNKSILGGSSANEVRITTTESQPSFYFEDITYDNDRMSFPYLPMWKLVTGTGGSDKNGLYYLRSSTPGYDFPCNDYPGISTNINAWGGPVLLNGTRQLNIQSTITSHGGLTLLGKVSGNQPLRIWGNRNDDGSAYHHPYLNLVCPENDFTSEFVVRYGGIRLWNPGAIGNPSVVKLEEGEVAFDNLCDDFGALPDLNANCGLGTWQNHVSLMYTNEVRFGRGEWKSVTKTGDERLWWYSGTGAKELNITGGFLKLPRRAKIAGLYSAQTNSYNGSDIERLYTLGGRAEGSEWCRARDLEPGVRSPNYKEHAYNNYNYKVDPAQPNRDAQWSTVIYSGYVWNNSPTNETWSFAGGGSKKYRLTIGDTVVYDVVRTGSGTLGHGTAVLAPGPNYFELANYRTYKRDTFTHYVDNWHNEYLNFAYKRSGDDSAIQSEYRRMEDPGDGSLFTFCLPGEEIVYPRHPGVTHTSLQPDFAHITFADGTGLDLEGVTNYVAASFTGWPIVTNATCFAVTNRWTLRTADLGTKALTTDGRLDLSRAILDFDDATVLPSQGDVVYRVAEAAGGVTGQPVVETGIPKRRYGTRVTADGKALELVRIPAGTKLYFR